MINLDDVKQMLGQAHQPTFSLYLDVDEAKQENQSAQPAWRIYLKNALSDLESQAPDVQLARQIRGRVADFFDGYTPDVKGFAAFFTADSQQTYELPVPVNAEWAFGKPLITPLLWAMDEYEPYLIVMVDQEKAELITAYLGSTTVEDKLESDLQAYDFGQKTLMPSASAVAGGHELTTGSNREAFQNMINEHIARFYREVVDHVESLQQHHPRMRIVIGGAEQSVHALRDLLPERLTDRIVAVTSIPMRLDEREIFDQVLPLALNYERDQELDLVLQVIDFAKAGGRGALGAKAVDEALTMQRVETLLLPWSPEEDDVSANELAARAFASGGTVELIHGAAADRLKREGGIGARLYYTL